MADIVKRIAKKGEYRHEEAVAGEAGIYPGMQIKLNSAGAVIKHATEGGALGDEILIAAEDALQGKTVDDVYTSGDIVTYYIPTRGAVMNMIAEAGTALGIGDKMHAAGDGTIQEASAAGSGVTIASVIGVIEEAVDLSASGAVDTLVPVRIS